MEDVLDLYEEPYDEKQPKVNFDETSKQLIEEVRHRCQPLMGRSSAWIMSTSATVRATFL